MSNDTAEERLHALEQRIASMAESHVDEGTRRLRARMAEERANAEAFQREVDRDVQQLNDGKRRFFEQQNQR
jgi:hypothetical protein